MSFNEIITLYPGNTTFEYRVLIMADILDEDDEMFQAMITLESEGSVIINDQADTATVTIQDLNRVLSVYIYVCDCVTACIPSCPIIIEERVCNEYLLVNDFIENIR